MIHQKPRPSDGPGANGLRGGKHIYSSKVRIGRYVEDIGGPAHFNKGFTTEDFETENSRYGGSRASLKFGADLPPVVSSEKPSTFQVFAPSQQDSSNTWSSTTRATYTSHSRTDNTTADVRKYAQSMENPQVEEYRKTWTQETDSARKFRFHVESRMPNNPAVRRFEAADIRLLPGTPIAAEKLRRKLVERHGILAFSALRYYLPGGSVSYSQFKQAAFDLTVDVTKSELDQVFSFFTPSDSFEKQHFMRTLLTNMSQYDDSHANKLCAALTDSEGLSVTEFIFRFISDDAPAEVVEGFQVYLNAYTDPEKGSIGADAIKTLCYDMFASAPYDYVHTLKILWR